MAANNAATYVNNGRVLASEAIRAAYNNGVNLAPFVQGNALPSFYVIYAGYGGASGCQTCIWEHASSISPPISVGGVWVSKYACSSELASTAGSRISGIGVVCHEYGHSLGMPDYYDTNGADGGQFDGTGQWDLMASGSWNGTGASVPAPHNPRSKMKLGWINPIVLNSPQTVTIPAGRIYRDAFFRINTPVIFFPEQYFLIENKIRDGFDKHVPGQNLLIYRATEPYEQSQNTTSPQRFYPVSANAPVSVPASGSGSASQYGNINRTSTPWPGSNNKTTFDNTSIPGMVTWNGGGFNQPITNITVYDDYITFDFMGGGLKTDFYIFLPYFYGCNFVPVSGSVSPTNKGESFSFRADLLPTFVLGEVTANHVKLTPSGGIYTITNVQEDQIIRISSLVSVNGYEDQNDEITIYPNPTTGKLTIESKDLVIKNIEILDIMGRKVSSHQPISSSHQQIDISHLTTGIYFVQLQTANGMITKKVVKE
jgi:M6 family metalloprotease-like protein